jgi:hypothetical protein
MEKTNQTAGNHCLAYKQLLSLAIHTEKQVGIRNIKGSFATVPRNSLLPRGVGRFEKAKISYACSRYFRRLLFVVLPSVPAILVRGLRRRQSKSASVTARLFCTLTQLGLIFILRCGPLGTMTYS